MNRVSAPVAPPSWTTASWLTASKYSSNLARSWPPSASLNSLDHSRQVYLPTHSITASKFTRSQPPSVSSNALDYGLQTRSIMAPKCMSKLARLWPPSASPNSVDYIHQVHLQTRSITASKYIFKERRRVYGGTGITEVQWVTGSIYSADPGVDRHHLISILYYHTMKIHYLSQLFGLTWSVRDIMDPRNCVGSPSQVVSYLLTRFLHFLNQNRSFSWIPFGCCKRCGRVLTVGCLPFRSIVSTQRPPNGASLKVLSMGVASCSSNDARVPSAARLNVCIHRERLQ